MAEYLNMTITRNILTMLSPVRSHVRRPRIKHPHTSSLIFTAAIYVDLDRILRDNRGIDHDVRSHVSRAAEWITCGQREHGNNCNVRSNMILSISHRNCIVRIHTNNGRFFCTLLHACGRYYTAAAITATLLICATPFLHFLNEQMADPVCRTTPLFPLPYTLYVC